MNALTWKTFAKLTCALKTFKTDTERERDVCSHRSRFLSIAIFKVLIIVFNLLLSHPSQRDGKLALKKFIFLSINCQESSILPFISSL